MYNTNIVNYKEGAKITIYSSTNTATTFKKQKLLGMRNRHTKRDFNTLVAILGTPEDKPPMCS